MRIEDPAGAETSDAEIESERGRASYMIQQSDQQIMTIRETRPIRRELKSNGMENWVTIPQRYCMEEYWRGKQYLSNADPAQWYDLTF